MLDTVVLVTNTTLNTKLIMIWNKIPATSGLLERTDFTTKKFK